MLCSLIFTCVCMIIPPPSLSFFFFFNDTATTEIYTLSLHDALPIYRFVWQDMIILSRGLILLRFVQKIESVCLERLDRKSTRLNSSHDQISYAVFCLKKKKKQNTNADSEQPTEETNRSLTTNITTS